MLLICKFWVNAELHGKYIQLLTLKLISRNENGWLVIQAMQFHGPLWVYTVLQNSAKFKPYRQFNQFDSDMVWKLKEFWHQWTNCTVTFMFPVYKQIFIHHTPIGADRVHNNKKTLLKKINTMKDYILRW